MAYWLICQSCKEWSKSNTPISSDKLCPICNQPFVPEKTRIKSIPDIRTENITQQEQNPPPASDANIIRLVPEVKEIIETQPTTDSLEIPVPLEIPSITDLQDISKFPDEPQAEDLPEVKEDAEVDDQPETEEITETTENIALQKQSDEPEASQSIESQENKTSMKQVPFMQRKKKERRPR